MSNSVKQPPHALRAFLIFAAGFWKDSGAFKAWGLTIGLLAALLSQIGLQLGLNAWNRHFFDALGAKDIDRLLAVVASLSILIVGFAIIGPLLVILRMVFQTRWRLWVTDKISGWWIADQRYYRLGLVAPELGAPEFRIADDVRAAIEPLVEFGIGILTAVITAASFAAILWKVGGSAEFSLGGAHIAIPAYMAVAAVVYAIIASTAAYFTGRPLVGKISDKNQSEAHFRAEMTRFRENAESIALIKGDEDELSAVRRNYATVVKDWYAIIWQQGIISVVLNVNAVLFPVIPLLLAAPKFLTDELTLGGVMQLVSAFSAVQGALIWFVDNFMRLAEWYASASRVVDLTNALQELDIGVHSVDDNMIGFAPSEDDAIHIENLSLADRGGRVMIDDASVRIGRGEKVIVSGESGSGKSTLIRAFAGLWPWGSGQIRVPQNARVAFAPQKPYVPAGTLRAALLYPFGDAAITDEAVFAALRRCGLGYLIKHLDDEEQRWDKTLSGGERQRLAFCRLLLQKPTIVIMDEATSALDEDSQNSLMNLFREDLAQATIISVGHRSEIEAFHDRKILIVKKEAGAKLSSSKLGSGWRGAAIRLSQTAFDLRKNAQSLGDNVFDIGKDAQGRVKSLFSKFLKKEND